MASDGDAHLMLSGADIADVQGDSDVLLEMVGAGAEVPSVREICLATIGRPPEARPDLGVEGRLEHAEDGWHVFVNARLPAPRARFKALHEVAHWFHHEVRPYYGIDLEERCDAMAACLVAPRAAFRAAIKSIGRHAVHELARVFNTTQSCALLRLGETTGRSVALQRPGGLIARGEEFSWPTSSALVRVLRDGRAQVHPIRIGDEPDRWGFAKRWEAM